jgi:hypothetical protein
MSELQTKIQQFFANQSNLQKMKEVLTRNNVYNEENFQELINSFIDGDRDASMIGDYLMNEFNLSFETAEKVSDELMDEILSEIYFDIYQNYTEHQKEMAEFVDENFGAEKTELTEQAPAEQILPVEREQISISAMDEENEKNVSLVGRQENQENSVDLAEIYSQFIKSSLFLNAVEAEKAIKAQINGDLAKLKNIFYESINAGDIIKIVGALRVIFNNGVKKFFMNDNRYNDFMNKYLAKSAVATTVSPDGSPVAMADKFQSENNELVAFNSNPTSKKYIILFIKLILEKKLHLSETQSAMIGVSLGSIVRASGEYDFSDIAYGEEETNKFVWAF